MPRWSQRSRRGTSTSQTAAEPFPGVANAPTFANIIDNMDGTVSFDVVAPSAYPSDTVRWDLYVSEGGGPVLQFSDMPLDGSLAAGPNVPLTQTWWLRSFNAQGNWTEGDTVVGPPEP